MKIGVVGNCQAPGFGMALQQLLEQHQIFAIEAIAAHRENRLQPAADLLLGCEMIFSHDLTDQFGPLSINALRQHHRNVRPMPVIAFTGFHPDCIYLGDGRTMFGSPLEAYHSAVAAAAFALGASVEAAIAQFNADVFRKLGYFDEFSKAQIFLGRTMRAAELDLFDELPDWMTRAPFMHSINHPKAFVLSSIARSLARRAELLPSTSPGMEPVLDLLSLSPVWPWYPELAQGFRCRGSYLFKKNGLPDCVAGPGILMTLREFVEASFAAYAGYPESAFSVPAVERVRRVLQQTL